MRFAGVIALGFVIGCGSGGGAPPRPTDDGGSTCNGNQMMCQGVCVDPMSDAKNCGGCGKPCMPMEVCSAGKCAAPCTNSQIACDGACVNPMTDPNHCGDCKTACANNTFCSMGHCSLSCMMPLSQCGQSCVDTRSDPDHCGGCNSPCAVLAHASRGCANSMCTLGACDMGFRDCDGQLATGCEVDVDNDPKNCGTCGKTCQNVANGSPGCTKGQCGVGSCLANFADCDGDPTNGCETNILTDLKNCGTCGKGCGMVANASASCTNGQCVIAQCNQGFRDCDAMYADGCEVNTVSDVGNCGACGNSCVTANATAACINSACAIGMCNQGFADCDKLVVNGCEIDTAMDLANCGGCGKVCAVANGTPVCTMGACTIGGCTKNFSDCDKMVGDGCEVNYTVDVNNCGGCNMKCQAVANATASCGGAMCKAICANGFVDCDMQYANGCEVSTQTDVNNCGGCGKVCVLANATPKCTAGACGVAACIGAFSDCNGIAADGCEVAPLMDIKNCGACFHVCSAQHAASTCANGVCGLGACNNGFADCDGVAANGCEVDLQNNAKNCTACGMACPNGQACVAGVCKKSFMNTTFGQPTSYNIGTVWAPAIGDLNNDGILDVAISSGATVVIRTGNGDGTLGGFNSINTVAGSTYLTLTDINKDGKLDIAVPGFSSNQIGIHLGAGDGATFSFSSFVSNPGPNMIAIADYNADNKLDLAVIDYNGGVFGQFQGNGDGTFMAVGATGVALPFAIVTGDINKDGHPDLAVADETNSRIMVFIGNPNGNGTFLAGVPYTTGTTPAALALGDFNNDGFVDMVVPNFGSGTIGMLLNNGNGTFKAQTTTIVNGNPHTAAVGDFNLDGNLDVAVSNVTPNNLLHILVGNGTGTLTVAASYSTQSDPRGVAAGDLSGDGRPDLVVADQGANNIQVFLNTSQ
jgi:hypothetical protein